MDARLDDYNWTEAFKPGYATPSPCLPGLDIDCSTFDRGDVVEIAGMVEGENDGDEWIIYGRLHDGRWFYLEAGCDYTGWG